MSERTSFGRCGQVGDVGKTHEHHFRGLDRRGCGLHLFEALQQHLPGAGEHRHGQPFGERPSPHAVAFGDRIASPGFRRELQPGHEMAEVEEILQDHQRVGPALIKPTHLRERSRRIAAQHVLQQIEDEPAIGDTQHVAHRGF